MIWLQKDQMIPYIGAHDLRQLKAKDLQEMINGVSEKYSYSTVKKVYECINACLKYAVKEGKIENKPASMVALPKRFQGDTKEIRCFLPEEAEKIKRECVRCYQNGNRIYRIGEIVIFLLNTGLRIGEALALELRIFFSFHIMES